MEFKKDGALALGLLCSILTLKNLLEPPAVRPSGERWLWIYEQMWNLLGPFGPFFFWAILAAVCFYYFDKSKYRDEL